MRIKSAQLQNYRSYDDSGVIKIGNITVLVGRNNSGKTAFIRAIAQLQAGIIGAEENDIRKGITGANVTVSLTGIDYANHFPGRSGLNWAEANIVHEIRKPAAGSLSARIRIVSPQGPSQDFEHIQGKEPRNFIYPYLAKRKVVDFDQQIDLPKTISVGRDLRHLNAKVTRLANQDHPLAGQYGELCKKVLGFRVSNHAALSGQQSGIHVGNTGYIPIEDMGEGVPNLVGLITMLCMAENRLFLIEELENDVHPEALKALLDVIIEKSATNQFIVSTHSNIVVKWLASQPGSLLYHVSLDYTPGAVPTSKIEPVGQSTEERAKVLEELGYELGDFDLWDGWLFLEEASAERIIRDYLVKWFAPKLSRVRTLSTNGTGRLKSKFDDFNRLFLFTHLEARYHNKAWVVADGDGDDDTSGSDAIETLKEMYCRRPDSVWQENHFFTWSKHDFEEYYPIHFAQRVQEVLAITDKKSKREAKKKLLDEVREWCDNQSEGEVKAAFETSAAEVIEKLRTIESALFE